jgi:hypothetical protein
MGKYKHRRSDDGQTGIIRHRICGTGLVGEFIVTTRERRNPGRGVVGYQPGRMIQLGGRLTKISGGDVPASVIIAKRMIAYTTPDGETHSV